MNEAKFHVTDKVIYKNEIYRINKNSNNEGIFKKRYYEIIQYYIVNDKPLNKRKIKTVEENELECYQNII